MPPAGRLKALTGHVIGASNTLEMKSRSYSLVRLPLTPMISIGCISSKIKLLVTYLRTTNNKLTLHQHKTFNQMTALIVIRTLWNL